MAKIRITAQKINELFGKYDDCQEEPVECGTRVRGFLKELLTTKSVPKNRMEKTAHLLEALKQNIAEAKRSEEASSLDPNSIIMSEKRKIDEQNLRLTLTKTKEWLNTLVEYQRLESLSMRYAVLATVSAVLIAIGATYGLFLFYPLSSWLIGQFTWAIGIVVSLIAGFYVWRGLRFNSNPTQAVVAIAVSVLVVVIMTTVIVLVGSALTAAIALIDHSPNFDTFFAAAPQGDLGIDHLVYLGSTYATVLVGLLVSIVVGLLIAVAAGNLIQKIIQLPVLRTKTLEPEEAEDDT